MDESGDLDFSSKGSKYFLFTAVVMERPFNNIYAELENYRCELLEFAIDNPVKKQKMHYFHAFDDNKYIKERVYKIIADNSGQLNAYCIKIEKAKTHPKLQNDKQFYVKFLNSIIKYIAKIYSDFDGMVIITDTPPIRHDKKILTKAIKEIIADISNIKHIYYQHPSCSHIGLQLADYITYAIHKKVHHNRLSEYELINQCIKSEFDIFRNGTRYFY